MNKIELAKSKIIDFYERNNGQVFVSFSGGKDSTVLLHLARSIYPNIQAVFSNTTNEDEDIIKYVKAQDNITWVRPKYNFQQVVAKYGFPLVSKENAQKINELKHTKSDKLKNIRLYGYQSHPTIKDGSGALPKKWQYLAKEEFDVTHKCCKILKKNPIQQWATEHNGLKPIIALMKDEGALRKQLALYGKDDDKKSYPFLKTGWTESDIWKYAKDNNIRFAECYYDRILPSGCTLKGVDRTGCVFCGFGIHLEGTGRLDKQRLKNEKRYNKMMSIENNGVTFEEAINTVINRNTPQRQKTLFDIDNF